MIYEVIGGAYRLVEDLAIKTNVTGFTYQDSRFHLTDYGFLIIYSGFVWDGATGAIDTDSVIKASCVHDVFCILINEGELPKTVQKTADKELVEIIEDYWEEQKQSDNFWKSCWAEFISPFTAVRRWWIYRAVRLYQENKQSAPQPIIREV